MEQYDLPKKPLIIQGLDHRYFSRKEKWSFKYLYEKFKDETFKVGEDDDGKKIRIPFKHYLEYVIK